MNSSFRRRRWPGVALVALALPGFLACEEATGFTDPEAVAFAAVAIDQVTLRPSEGERLTVGPGAHALEVDVHWQNMPTGSELVLSVEAQESVSGQTFRWEGNLFEERTTLTTSSGEANVSGTFTLPEVSPFCGSYDHLRVLAAVSAPGGSPAAGFRDEVFYPVSGSNWSGPCMSDVLTVFPGSARRIGEPILVYGRDLPDALDVSFPGSQQDDNVWPYFIPLPEAASLYPVPDDGYVIAFVPLGAESGRVRAFAGASEVRYGPDGDVSLQISPLAADVFEPNNNPEEATDSIYFDLWDPFGIWGAYGYNPSLTLTGADLTPDPVAPVYGVGDWFLVFGEGAASTVIDVCINIAGRAGAFDDIDLIVYDINGDIAVESATASNEEGVRIDGVSGDEVYWAWVAPYLEGMSSSASAYTYEVGHCAGATGTAIARPDQPFGFDASGQSAAQVRTAAAGRNRLPSAQFIRASLPQRARGQRGGVR